MATQPQPPPHPHLHEPKLHVGGLIAHAVTPQEIANLLGGCLPVKITIQQEGAAQGQVCSGTIEFRSQHAAEKALTLYPTLHLPAHQIVLQLSATFPPHQTPLPPPEAYPRIIRNLPREITPQEVYDLVRPWGAVASVRMLNQGVAVVEWWEEARGEQAQADMHCMEVGGQMISVQLYQPRKNTAEFSAQAPVFVPGAAYQPGGFHANTGFPGGFVGSPPAAAAYFNHGPGQQVQYAPPGSTTSSGLVDPCNLFCKNLDTNITSNDLFFHFKAYGRIVSARVMRDADGNSKGFGFVSFQTPDEANAALRSMNGATIGSKQIIVRLHEPKQLRQEKLAQRFATGQGGHPARARSASGSATSPTPSEAGGAAAFSAGAELNRSPGGTTSVRRGSGSYYKAAMASSVTPGMDELQTLTPAVRNEVLSGHFAKRIGDLPEPVPAAELDSILDRLVGMKLTDVVESLGNQGELARKVSEIRESLHSSPARETGTGTTTSPHAGTLSADITPSTPLSRVPSVTSSTATSPSPASERERLLGAVEKLNGSAQSEDIVDLLMGLPKKERALCLFNGEYLAEKVRSAREVLDADEEDDARAPSTHSAPATESPKKTSEPALKASSSDPALVPAAQAGAGAAPVTLATLSALPAKEILERLQSGVPETGLPVPKADAATAKETDEFVDSIAHLNATGQKQKVGDKLFKIVKSFGVKNAPKITIFLLDREDLRSLAHLMNEYPVVLKEKVQGIVERGEIKA